MQLEEARRVTRELVKNEANALDALAREELGLNPDDLGSPWGAAIFSFLAFSIGAVLPLVPFLFGLPLQRRSCCGDRRHRAVRRRRRAEPVHGRSASRRTAHGADRRRRGRRTG